jgi:hypothetical protein
MLHIKETAREERSTLKHENWTTLCALDEGGRDVEMNTTVKHSPGFGFSEPPTACTAAAETMIRGGIFFHRHA